MIDPAAITLIQNSFLQRITAEFGVVAHYAKNLLYFFTVFELVIFGLIWALRHDTAFEQLFFKILKIGLIFFILQNSTTLLNDVIQSFAKLGGIVTSAPHLGDTIFNPAKLWQYGYDVALALLKLAAQSNVIGLSLIQTTLGIGILLVFALLGIQIVIQIVGFYLVALTALILIPIGIFNPTSNFFDEGVRSVLKSGARVMALIVVIGVAVTTWQTLQVAQLAPPFNINQVLGLFFSGLLFLCLAIYLPRFVSEMIGKITTHSYGVASNSTPHFTSSYTQSNLRPDSLDVRAATQIEPTSLAAGASTSNFSQTVAASQITVATNNASGNGSLSAKRKSRGDDLGDASNINKSISDKNLKKITKALTKVLKEQ